MRDAPRMASEKTSYDGPSTTWEWRKVKIRRPPEANEHSRPKGVRWRRFPRRDPRKPITVSLKLRGGPEAWVEVKGRGETNRYPGYVTIAEVLFDINNAH